MQKWFLEINGQQEGPFTFEEVRAKAAAAEIGLQNLVWCSGMDDWAPLSATTLRQLVSADDMPRVPRPPQFPQGSRVSSYSASPYGNLPQARAPMPQNNIAGLYGPAPMAGQPYCPAVTNTRSIVGVVFSGLSLTLFALPFVGAAFALVGVFLGMSGIRRARRVAQQPMNANSGYLIRESQSIGRAAFWIGLSSLVLNLLFTIFFMAFINQVDSFEHEFHRDFERQYEHRLDREFGPDWGHSHDDPYESKSERRERRIY
ncbi:MAG: DUF4339 domain-containing protein [Planctomycetes bacterium]|nr:DUF4339 domain-containing protein [Planctomycetota bacterium]